MDLVDVFSSSSDEQNHQSQFSDSIRDNISTDVERSSKHKAKTKNIKKKYDPIEEGGRVYHYEDDPQEYRRIRKKIQNRLSARRVRGRKENAFESLEQEVQYLRKTNSELQLSNARLQTENRTLKQQLQFMKTLVKPTNVQQIKQSDPIERYLTPETLTEQNNSSGHSDFESPFMEDESDWLRIPANRRSISNNSWTMLAVMTLVLAVFVIPEETGVKVPTVLWQSGNSGANVEKGFMQSLVGYGVFLVELLKAGFKYGLIFGYIWFVYDLCSKHMKRKKMKKV